MTRNDFKVTPDQRKSINIAKQKAKAISQEREDKSKIIEKYDDDLAEINFAIQKLKAKKLPKANTPEKIESIKTDIAKYESQVENIQLAIQAQNHELERMLDEYRSACSELEGIYKNIRTNMLETLWPDWSSSRVPPHTTVEQIQWLYILYRFRTNTPLSFMEFLLHRALKPHQDDFRRIRNKLSDIITIE